MRLPYYPLARTREIVSKRNRESERDMRQSERDAEGGERKGEIKRERVRMCVRVFMCESVCVCVCECEYAVCVSSDSASPHAN
jgi:hypothetical protein